MAPQPAGALEEGIDRREIGDHQVEIEVERTLGDLGRHQHPAAPSLRRRLLAEPGPHPVLDREAVAHGEAGVEEVGIEARLRQARLRQARRSQGRRALDGVVDAVADPGDAGPGIRRGADPGEGGRPVRHPGDREGAAEIGPGGEILFLRVPPGRQQVASGYLVPVSTAPAAPTARRQLVTSLALAAEGRVAERITVVPPPAAWKATSSASSVLT